MSQSFISWELCETKDYGPFKYSILSVTTAENKPSYAGWVVFAKGGDYWLHNDNKDALRSGLITLGQQRA